MSNDCGTADCVAGVQTRYVGIDTLDKTMCYLLQQRCAPMWYDTGGIESGCLSLQCNSNLVDSEMWI